MPISLLGIALLFVGSWLSWSYPQEVYNWDAFGRLPISHEGRIQPLQSYAINTLKIISGKSIVHDKDGKLEPQSKWLLDVMTRSGDWEDCKVFRVDHNQVKDTLGLLPNERYFSWNELFPKTSQNREKLEQQAELADDVPVGDRDLGQNQIIDLARHVRIINNIQQLANVQDQREANSIPDVSPEQSQALLREIGSAIMQIDPTFISRLQSAADEEKGQRVIDQAVMRNQGRLAVDHPEALNWYMRRLRPVMLASMPEEAKLFLSAPLKPGEKWTALSDDVLNSTMPEAAEAFLKIAADYQHKDAGAFNTDIANYDARLEAALPSDMQKVNAEVIFNNFDPFFISMLLYVLAFLTISTSWLVWRKPFWIAALALMIFTLLIHTTGLGFRVYLTGRGPVTNLYASAIFIGWVIILLSLALEAIYRNGIGLATGAATGFTSLLVGSALASTEGDTMKQVVAVLDKNFWLWTHVTCVTIGYASTFLAGALAIVYVGFDTIAPDGDKESKKTLSRMVYGIICFALLFSFVGTILGGLWADKSWGRFWGWDPKENGAVLIVLWNALILHARWSGMVRDKGVALLAVIGNIVTSWSWFGTNMLGIGLHSYGFMRSAQFWLVLWMVSQVMIVAIGLMPRQWFGHREESNA